jgi:hypothetical protein
MSETAYPPDYIKTPPAIARARVDKALIVTMIRILGLCWQHKYRYSPAYTPGQLVDLLGRPRTTLYRHLHRLEQLGWLRVDHQGKRLVLRPLVGNQAGQAPAPPPAGQAGGDVPVPGADEDHELKEALAEAGILGRPCRELARRGVDPALVRAWTLWTWAPDQEWLDNRAGYIVRRLVAGDRPPPEFLALARLSAQETALLRKAWFQSEAYQGWPSLDGHDELRALAPLWVAIHTARRRREP